MSWVNVCMRARSDDSDDSSDNRRNRLTWHRSGESVDILCPKTASNVQSGAWHVYRLRKLPNKSAFIFKDRRITYSVFEERVNRLANGLLAKGYRPGDHVGILAYNCIEYFEIRFALGKVGMVAAPINFRLVGPEITYLVNHSDSRALVYEACFREVFSRDRSDFIQVGEKDFIVFGGEGEAGDTVYEDLLAESSREDPDVVVEETMTWYIGYTSGTTGRPKGALRSHRANILLVLNVSNTDEETVNLMIMPIFHSNSIWVGLNGVLNGGTTYIYPSGGFDPRKILEIIEKEKITFSSMVPTMSFLRPGRTLLPDQDSGCGRQRMSAGPSRRTIRDKSGHVRGLLQAA